MSGQPGRPWGVLAPLALGRTPAATVAVHSTTVPAGGLLTFMASGFEPEATLRVYVDYRPTPIGSFTVDTFGRTPEISRLAVPLSARPGPHVLTFDDGDAEFDLLIRTTPSTASVTVEPAAVQPGGRLRFAGRGFPAGQVVSVKLDAVTEPVEFPIGADGTISGSIAIAAATPVGVHELRFLAADPPTSTAVPVTVAP